MKIGLLCVLFSFVALSVGSALNESLTYDEVFYRQEGRQIIRTRSFSDPYNPPLMPVLTGIAGNAGRFVTVALGVILIIAVYQSGGQIAALLLAFHPTFLAHSHYITSDVAATLFIFLGYLAWKRYLVRVTLVNALQIGVAVGLALATKITTIGYFGIVIVVLGRFHKLRRAIAWFIVVSTLLMLWAAYFFTWDTVIRERDDPGRVSVRLEAYAKEHNVAIVSSVITFLREQPLPLGTYTATIKNNILRAGKPSDVFFNGFIYDRSQWYFMIVNSFRKTPVPFLLLIGLGIVNQKDKKVRKMFAIGAGIILVASFTGMAPLDRYILPAVPFLALVAAAGVRKKILILLLLWQIVGTIWQYPHFISYANELAGTRDRRHEILSDSNLDWGQALPDMGRYVRNKSIGRVSFSYFGRDDASQYGLPSPTAYGSWKFEEICAFHEVDLDPNIPRKATIISVTNWYACGYNSQEAYRKEKIREVVADVFLIF